ncbi:MAG TPA: hypothetical protein VE619_09240 [Nitrososphaeraceae archaeon]|nr:hypothetical protein [Nitrososphaeraceae archaeon]
MEGGAGGIGGGGGELWGSGEGAADLIVRKGIGDGLAVRVAFRSRV